MVRKYSIEPQGKDKPGLKTSEAWIAAGTAGTILIRPGPVKQIFAQMSETNQAVSIVCLTIIASVYAMCRTWIKINS